MVHCIFSEAMGQESEDLQTDNGMEYLAAIEEMGVRPDVELQETEEQKESSDFRGDSCSASSVEMYEFSRH